MQNNEHNNKIAIDKYSFSTKVNLRTKINLAKCKIISFEVIKLLILNLLIFIYIKIKLNNIILILSALKKKIYMFQNIIDIYKVLI